MYLTFYGLREKPFSQTPDPRFLYWNDSYREALASLRYGIQERKGFLTMIGEAGTGKTTLLRKLLDDLGPDVVSVFLFNPNASFEEILEYTLSELGIMVPSGRKLAMLQRLNEFLLAAFAEGKNTILVIDEAQDLDTEVLESLRLLSNLETAKDKILQIVLSGQTELAARLAQDNLRQLKQRIAVRCRLEPLQRAELAEYIQARLRIAGREEPLFEDGCLDAIWSFANGIPRLVNAVCDNALLVGYAVGKQRIDRAAVDEVVHDLRRLDDDAPAVAAAPPAPVQPSRVAPPPPAPSVGDEVAAAPAFAPSPPPRAPAPEAPAPAAPAGADRPPAAEARYGEAPRPRVTGDERAVPVAVRQRSGAGRTAALAAAAVLLVAGGVWVGSRLGGRSDDAPERVRLAAQAPLTRPAPPPAPPAAAARPPAAARPSEPSAPPPPAVAAPEPPVPAAGIAATAHQDGGAAATGPSAPEAPTAAPHGEAAAPHGEPVAPAAAPHGEPVAPAAVAPRPPGARPRDDRAIADASDPGTSAPAGEPAAAGAAAGATSPSAGRPIQPVERPAGATARGLAPRLSTAGPAAGSAPVEAAPAPSGSDDAGAHGSQSRSAARRSARATALPASPDTAARATTTADLASAQRSAASSAAGQPATSTRSSRRRGERAPDAEERDEQVAARALDEPAPAIDTPQDVQDSPVAADVAGKRIVVHQGDTLYELAWRTYGTANYTTLDMLRAANPGIRDVNRIVAGRVLTFPDPGPEARVVSESGSTSVLALTTPEVSQAEGVQRKLQEQYGEKVDIEPVVLGEGQRLYRVSLRDLQGESRARSIAESLGTILKDPDQRPGS